MTDARLPPEALYHTTIEGLAGGASRTLAHLNYPVALIALGVLPLAARTSRGRCGGRVEPLGRLGRIVVAAAAMFVLWFRPRSGRGARDAY